MTAMKTTIMAMRKATMVLSTAAAMIAAMGPAPAAGASQRSAGDAMWNPRLLKYPPLREIKLPDVQRIVLPNGMVLYLLEDHDYPTVEGQILMRVGSVLDPTDKTGLGQITGEVLRTGGTGTHPGDQLDKTLEGMGASLEFSVGRSEANGQFWCLRDNANEVLSDMADLLQHPSFPEEKIDLAKVDMRRDIAGRNDQPEDILFREMRRMIYGQAHPFARIPEYATVDAITRDDLVAFHDRYFRPDRTYLTIWGDFDARTIRSQLESLFAGWKPAGEPAPAEPPSPRIVPGGGIYYAEKKGMSNGWVVVGHIGIKADSPDYAAMNVLGELLGGGFGSRLFNEIRTKRGLAYETGSTSGTDVPRPGIFLAYASTRAESTLTVLDAVKKEVARVTESPVSTSELEAAKNTILNSYIFKFATKGQIAARMAYLDFYGYPPDFTAKYPAQVRSVTVSKLLDVARRDIHPGDLQVLLVGNQGDFATPLSSLPDVQVLDLTIPEPPSKSEAAPPATPESLAKGKEIITRAAQSTGGSAAWSSIKNMILDSETTITIQGMPMTIASHRVQTKDGRDYLSQKLPFGEVLLVRMGDGGWKKSPRGVEDLTADDMSEIDEDHARGFWSLFSRPDTYQAQAIDGQEVDGKPCDAVLLTGGGIDRATLFVDPKSSFPVAVRYKGSSPQGGPAENMEIYGDWRTIGPVMIPFSVRTLVDGKPFGDAVVKDAQVNGRVDEKLFARPAH